MVNGESGLLFESIPTTQLRFSVSVSSIAENCGVNFFSNISASSTPTRNDMVVPTLPSTAPRIESVSCAIYWCAMFKLSLYFRASDKICSMLSLVKF